MHQFDGWSERNEQIDTLLKVVWEHRERVEHLGRAKRVADVSDFILLSVISHIFDLDREVVLAHVDEAVLPEALAVFLVIGVEADVTSAILAAAGVPKPYVVAGTRELERRCHIVLVDYPSVSGAQEPVLQQHGRLPPAAKEALILDSEHVQNIAIVGLDSVALVSEAV